MMAMHFDPHNKPDLLAVFGSTASFTRAGKYELHGPCPFCGGHDRFAINTNSQRWWCRQCNPDEHWGDVYDYYRKLHNCSLVEAMTALGTYEQPTPARTDPIPLRPAAEKRLGGTWDYTDASGSVLYQVRRWNEGDGNKTFSQHRHLGDGLFAEGAKAGPSDTKKVLYRLPELLKVPPGGQIVFVEGEKCADALAALGYTATTLVGGSGAKWLRQYNDIVRDRAIVIIPDNDDPGDKYAATLQAGMREIARSVVTCPAPDSHNDIADWIAAGGTAEQLEAHIKQAARGSRAKRRYCTTDSDLSAAVLPPIDWVIEELVTEGLTLFAGKSKLGKSFFVTQLALCLGAGIPAFGRFAVPGKRDVYYLDLETNEREMKARLDSAFTAIPRSGHVTFDAPECGIHTGLLDEIRFFVEEHPTTGLVVVDTLAAATRGGMNSKNGNVFREEYDTLAQLSLLSQELHVAIWVIHHTRKESSDDVFDSISGSVGLQAATTNMCVLTGKDGEYQLHMRGRSAPSKTHTFTRQDEGAFVYSAADGTERTGTETEQKVIRWLNDHPGSVISDISKGSGVSFEYAKKVVPELVDSGKIAITGKRQPANGGRPWNEYSVVGKNSVFYIH